MFKVERPGDQKQCYNHTKLYTRGGKLYILFEGREGKANENSRVDGHYKCKDQKYTFQAVLLLLLLLILKYSFLAMLKEACIDDFSIFVNNYTKMH